MTLKEKYLSGWKIIYRLLVFNVCAAIGYIPAALLIFAVEFFFGEESMVLTITTLAFFVGYLPFCFYFGSWYSGEFKDEKIQQVAAGNGSQTGRL